MILFLVHPAEMSSDKLFQGSCSSLSLFLRLSLFPYHGSLARNLKNNRWDILGLSPASELPAQPFPFVDEALKLLALIIRDTMTPKMYELSGFMHLLSSSCMFSYRMKNEFSGMKTFPL